MVRFANIVIPLFVGSGLRLPNLNLISNFGIFRTIESRTLDVIKLDALAIDSREAEAESVELCLGEIVGDIADIIIGRFSGMCAGPL